MLFYPYCIKLTELIRQVQSVWIDFISSEAKDIKRRKLVYVVADSDGVERID